MTDAEARAEHGYAQTEAMLALEGELQARQDELDRLREDARALYASLRRMTDGAPWGDDEDAEAALAEATALLGRSRPALRHR